jgi:hypothetical protein
MTTARYAVILSLLACNSLAFQWQNILRTPLPATELMHSKDVEEYAVILSLLACSSLAFQWQNILRTPPLRVSATEPNDMAEVEDEMSQTSFTAENMEWTQKYRKLIPYEHARLRAMGLGVSSKEDYDKLRSYHGPYLPSRPHEMYKEEWTSWEEFLGTMRSYEETQVIVRNVLKVTSMEAYHKRVFDDPKQAEGQIIPARPDV